MDKYSHEWAKEKKKTCKNCQKTAFYCLRHEPRVIHKSSRQWGGMYHQVKCTFYLKLMDKDPWSIIRYCGEILDQSKKEGFKPWDIKCPKCKGWDISFRKNI